MSGTQNSRPLHLQTVESLFAELIGGASVSVGEDGAEFQLEKADSRAILNWYRLNRGKWAGNVMAPDVEAIVSTMLTVPPALPIPDIVTPKAGRRLRLVRVVAHRFAGVHAYGTADAPPPDFVFEPREPITLFDGWNGAGKTSLLNTIIWCLTGEMLRPQRQPESGQEEFDSLFVRTTDGNEEATSHALTPVTPLPNPAYYAPPIGKPVPIDSWVELTFVDQDDKVLPPVRRTQLRTPKGKVSETQSGFDTLGIDPIASRIGTIMPALLQFIRVGAASDLGLAAAKLTGLADISSLAKHASKAREKLKREFKKEREKEIEDADLRFLEARGDLQKQITEYPDMAFADPLPTPSASKDLEPKLASLENHFNTLKANALAAAKTILGPSFDPADKAARDGLESSIGPAQGQLKSLGQLASVRRSRALSELTDADWQAVDNLLIQLRAEAAVLAELAATPEVGRRKQLYARVAGWMAEAKTAHDASSCAVCNHSLEGVIDPVTQRKVAEHLSEVSEDEQRLLSLTQQNWAAGWTGTLAAKCPPALQAELTRDLPLVPSDLIRSALVDDLFESEAFKATLAPLKVGVVLLCDQELAKLPAFAEPLIETLPAALDKVSAPLLLSIKRLKRARAFARWRADHLMKVTEITKAIMQESEGSATVIADLTPIGGKLEALASIVKGVAPLNAALELCQRMVVQLKTRRTKEERLLLYGRAVVALDSVIELGSLAEKQVDGLRKLLHARATYWRDRCYHNSFPMAGHALRDTAMDVKGVLDIRVGFERANAPAQHISNASALRASLMGFFLAFWEHVLAERGGLALLIFDDPQELLDHDNKEKLARLLPELAKQGGQLVVATYDRSFARSAVAAGRKHSTIEHRSVHPVNPSRDTLNTAAAVEELDRKRGAYEKDQDNAPLAQDYANEVRIFLEARLADLFDDPAYPAYSTISKAPTLVAHLDRLRSLVNSPPNVLFKGQAVANFCDCVALAQDAECLKVLNTAHHNKSSLSAGDVYAVAGDLDLVRKLAEKMHIEFRHWRWHEPLQQATIPTNVVAFKSVAPPACKVLIHPDLAAFTATSGHEATQDTASEVFDGSWFADKSLFLVRKDNLGFSVPAGCIAIVESNSYDGRDHNLVIARQPGHLLARRLFRPPHGDELALAAEAPDPRQSKPTLLFNAGSVVLHRIVGMLTEQPVPPFGTGEATELPSAASLSQIKAAYKVRNESGIPLALPGQIVLGGDIISKNQLAAEEETLVALCLDDESSIFKRVGKPVPGTNGQLLQFESFGGLGSSIVVSLAEPDEKSDVPRFVCARRVIGVLYTA